MTRSIFINRCLLVGLALQAPFTALFMAARFWWQAVAGMARIVNEHWPRAGGAVRNADRFK